jgi:hypothetical protein
MLCRAQRDEIAGKKLVALAARLFICLMRVRLAALCCMRRQCAEILPRSQELDLQLHQQGQSWTLTLFSVPIIAFRTRETRRPFAFLLTGAPSTSKRQMLKVNLNFSLMPVSLRW